MDLYASAIRPLVFRLSPERSHELAKPALRSARLCRLLARPGREDPRLAVQLAGLELSNPVGLAPGFDKYGELTAGMSRLGFGYLVPGTISDEVRTDAPRPRLLRLPRERALINCMGVPSKGAEYSAAALERGRSAVPLIVSIGGTGVESFLRCHARLEPLAGAIELNVQCHNDEAGSFEELAEFERLVAAVVRQKRKPLFLKVNAWHGEEERRLRMEMVERGAALGIDGFSAVGTFINRSDDRLSLGSGIVSGEPLKDLTLQAIRDIKEVTGGRAAIRARGGISSGEDACRAIAAGATTVEVFTGFVYEGWQIARRVNAELLAILERERLPSVSALRGP